LPLKFLFFLSRNWLKLVSRSTNIFSTASVAGRKFAWRRQNRLDLTLVCTTHRCTLIFKLFWAGYLVLWGNLGGGPLFLFFFAFLWSNFSRSSEGAPYHRPPPLCASMAQLFTIAGLVRSHDSLTFAEKRARL